ncbi:MAG: ABC transporter ATP-binding protein [Bacillota bacterium]|nr:ABC transporter ATP-binding protein [Bacillota bacterium]
MNSNYAIELSDVTMNYGKHMALDHMNLQLEPNKIYGLLGRNGAGKTTMLNILASKVFQTSGKAKVFGSASYENINILKKICLIEEKGFYSSHITVARALKLASGLYPNWDKKYADELLRLFELNPKKRFKQLSRGMESSLGLIIGLASRAPLTIFDEPSLGLDAVIRERFYDAVIEDFQKYPRTIIISTHLIDEVSRLFENVIIVDRGKILLQSDTMELKEKAYYISGKEDAVKACAEGTIILDEERFGSTFIYSVYSRNGLKCQNDVEIQSIPLQKLFVYFINPKIHDLLEKGGVLQ